MAHDLLTHAEVSLHLLAQLTICALCVIDIYRYPIPSKENVRLCLGFSSTYSSSDLVVSNSSIFIKADIKRGPYVMTDGCGFMSVRAE